MPQSQAQIDKYDRIMRYGVVVDPPCSFCMTPARQAKGVVCKKLAGESNKCGQCFKQHRVCSAKDWIPPANGGGDDEEEDEAEAKDEHENDDAESDYQLHVEADQEEESRSSTPAIASAEPTAALYAPIFHNQSHPARPKTARKTVPGYEVSESDPVPRVLPPTVPRPIPAAARRHISEYSPEELPVAPRYNLYNQLGVEANNQNIRGFDVAQSHRQLADLPAGRYPVFQVKVDGKFMTAALLLPKGGSTIFRGGLEEGDGNAAKRKDFGGDGAGDEEDEDAQPAKRRR